MYSLLALFRGWIVNSLLYGVGNNLKVFAIAILFAPPRLRPVFDALGGMLVIIGDELSGAEALLWRTTDLKVYAMLRATFRRAPVREICTPGSVGFGQPDGGPSTRSAPLE